MIPVEFVAGKLYQPIEGMDCQKCALCRHPDDTCYALRCVPWRRDDDKHVYYVEVD